MTTSRDARIRPLDVDEVLSRAALFDTSDIDTIAGRAFYRTLSHHPALLTGYLRFIDGIRPGLMPQRDRELITLRVAARCECTYVQRQHRPIALAAGLSPDELARLAAHERDDSTPSHWSAHDQALLLGVDELLSSHTVSDGTWLTLSAGYGPSQLLEYVFMVGRVTMACGFLNSVGIDREPG